jgi:hypothetical protein
VNISEYLELDVIVTTQSSPLLFQFTEPNLSFLQTSFPTNTPNLFYDAINNRLGIGCNAPGYTLTVSGSIYASGNITSNSDSRLKNVIGPISNGLSFIEQLNPITFTMKDDTTARVKHGFLAQELREILPDMIYETPDETKTLHLSYGDLVAPLTSAVKQLSIRLALLESQFASQTSQ